MRRGAAAALFVLLGVLGAPARQAAAVCTAAEVMAGCGGACTASCTASACTISRTATVTPPTLGATCTFDFGTRDVTLQSGGFVGGSNTFEIRAHKLTLNTGGRLTAAGGNSAPGGVIILTLGTGGFVVNSGADPVSVVGVPGGSINVNSDGDVTISKAITAEGGTSTTAGGSIGITAGRRAPDASLVASGNITLLGGTSGGLSAAAITSGSGLGGNISLTAYGASGSGKIDLENALDVRGGTNGGGSISIDSDGDTILGQSPKAIFLDADGFGDAGSGGSIDVLAGGKIDGSAGKTGPISALGHSAAITGDPGGAGGAITLEAENGVVNIGGASAGGTLSADGAGGSCGGSVSITQDAPDTAAVTIAVPVTVTGPGTSGSTGTTNDGAGGSVCLCAAGPTTFSQTVDASGGGGGGGLMELDTTGASLTFNGAVHADGVGDGGCISLCSSGNIAINAAVSSKRGVTNLTTGNGGGVTALADGSISVNALVDVSTAGSNSGGCADLEAGLNLTVTSTGVVSADGGNVTNSSGGNITLIAGSPDLAGNLTLNGNVHANGQSTILNANGIAELDGCTVHIASTGIVNTMGDQAAHNTFTVRKSFVVDSGAQIKTTGGNASSRNFLILPTGSTPPTTGTFSPPLAPSDETFLPPCTAPGQSNCLTPCPVCGNNVTEFPESCDTGTPNACCDATCRAPNCNDSNPCTTDTCSPSTGCTNTPIVGCTTTTTSTTLRPTTTTTRPTTTTTLATTTTTLGGGTTTTTIATTTTTVATTTTTLGGGTTTTTIATTTTTIATTTTTIATTTTTVATTTTTTTTIATTTTTIATTTTTIATTTTTVATTTTTIATTTTTTSTSTTTTTTPGVQFGGDDTGCIPDSKNHLKCGDSIGKAFGKAIRAVIVCHQKQAGAVFATLNGKTTTFSEELCEEGPNGGKSAKEKFEAALAKIGPAGKKLCSSQQLTAAAAQEAVLFADRSNTGSLDALNGQIYCDGGASIDASGDDAGTLDPAGLTGKLKLKCADTVGRELGKLAAGVILCHQKQADAMFAGRLFQEEVCEESDPAKHKSALEKYGAAMDKLDAKSICSQPCLSRSNRNALGTSVLGRIESANQVAYPCQ